MERELLVFMDMAGETVPVGRLWARTRGARETASFEYDPSWLARRDAFGLDPVLPPARGQFHTDRPLFNAFTDPAPDRWGQTLMRRNERRRARAEGRQPRTLLAVDFLTLVDDETRLGALRSLVSEPGACGIASRTGIKSFADAFKREYIMGSSGPNVLKHYPTLFNKLLGAKFKIVRGYKSSTEISLAVERGEMEGVCQS